MAAIFKKFRYGVVNRAAVAVSLSVSFCEFPFDHAISGSFGKFGLTVAVQIMPLPADKQIHADKQKQFSSLKY
ncbi:hypothetical protein H3S80_06380 [Bartonella sp. M0177]|uniref:hypothetical protein n=1 Tax=Bartonella sp. M0177 TaxID=2750940 RepID=UPI0018DD4058|nr:hypothetical protein [Bartonella sp. M0177]MBI0003676.1 hypothetical protein [Bartonella sp. M0177]